ncbi:MAG TPA: hypothetical protein VLF60_01710 [Candidatus Saccharimonadales bacterium]|nr:hypothetical protein [Candidatus Saccharimonadales bacterium]
MIEQFSPEELPHLPFMEEITSKKGVPDARHHAQEALEGEGIDRGHIKSFLFLLAELATNGVEHTGSAMLCLSGKDGRLRLEVIDSDPTSVGKINEGLAAKPHELSLKELDDLSWDDSEDSKSLVTDGRGLSSVFELSPVEACVAVPFAEGCGKYVLLVYNANDSETQVSPPVTDQEPNDLTQAA